MKMVTHNHNQVYIRKQQKMVLTEILSNLCVDLYCTLLMNYENNFFKLSN